MWNKILTKLKELTSHHYIEIVSRGNYAIDVAFSIIPKDKIVLIPEEGGWIHYEKAPKKLGLTALKVKCDDAKLNLTNLKDKLNHHNCGALLYQNPGGYFAEQPMKEIYQLCRKHNCLVILDVSGSIGTKLCDGKYADILIGSFGEWKLVEAKIGGFISSQDKSLFEQLKLEKLHDEEALNSINEALQRLPKRIKYLTELRKKIVSDLTSYEVVRPKELGFVVVVKYKNEVEKAQLMEYCHKNKYPFTQCPRYIRLNSPAISIEIKQLE